MSQQQLLNRVLDVLEQLEVASMLTGSWASSLQGLPRSTHDLDLVVSLQSVAIDGLLDAFSAPTYYLDRRSIEDAIAHQAMFNLLEISTGSKVDFWLLTDDPWDVQRFAKRIQIEVGGRMVSVSRPEDTIVAKLRWSQLSGGSERQIQDALHVSKFNWDSLDHAHIERWCATLGVAEDWNRLKEEIARPNG